MKTIIMMHSNGNETEMRGVVAVEFDNGKLLVQTTGAKDSFHDVVRFKLIDDDERPVISSRLQKMRPWNTDQVVIVDIHEIEAQGMSNQKEMVVKILNDGRFGNNMAIDSFVDQTGLINFLVWGTLWIRFKPDEFFKMSDSLRKCFETHETFLKL